MALKKAACPCCGKELTLTRDISESIYVRKVDWANYERDDARSATVDYLPYDTNCTEVVLSCQHCSASFPFDEIKEVVGDRDAHIQQILHLISLLEPKPKEIARIVAHLELKKI